MMAEHLSEMDTEMDLLEAFASFDENDSGKISGTELRKWLGDVGDKMSEEEVSWLDRLDFVEEGSGTDVDLFICWI